MVMCALRHDRQSELMMETEIQTPGEQDFAGDDRVLPFEVDGLDVRGRTVQLGPMIDAILGRHAYPEPVARLLAEAIALTVLLGTSLKFEGKLIVQTKGDGPVDLLVADFRHPAICAPMPALMKSAWRPRKLPGRRSLPNCSAMAFSPLPLIRVPTCSATRASSR
jgi:hypothetical protein